MEQGTYRTKDLTEFLKNRNKYSREERKEIRTYFRNATLERKEIEFTPLPEVKPIVYTPEQREKALLEMRKQINRELRVLRRQIRRC